MLCHIEQLCYLQTVSFVNIIYLSKPGLILVPGLKYQMYGRIEKWEMGIYSLYIIQSTGKHDIIIYFLVTFYIFASKIFASKINQN